MATPEEFIAAWRDLNSDPRFQALTYEEQQKTRAQWAERNLPKNPQFTALNAVGQEKVFRSMVTQPPTFENRDENVQQMLDVGRGIQAGDPEALRAASARIAGYRATNFSGVLYKLASSIGEQLLGEDANLAPTEAGSDEEKAIQYLEQEFQRSDDKTFWQSALTNVAPFVGIAANLTSGRVAAQPLLGATRAAGARGLMFDRSGAMTAATQRITGSMGSTLASGTARYAKWMGKSRFGRWMGQSVLPEVVESGLDATMLAAGDYFNNRLQENAPFDIEAKTEFGQLAANFGMDFVGDMVFFGTANLLGSIFKSGLKVARLRGFEPRSVKHISEADFETVNESLLSGREMPTATWDNLPRETQQLVQRTRRTFAAAKNLEDASPNDKARVAALGKGYDMRQVDGAIEVLPIGGRPTVPGRYTNEQKALRGIVEHNIAPPEQEIKVMDAVVQNEAGVSRIARFQIGDKLPDFNEQTVARTLTPNEGGQIRPEPIRTALQSNLQRAGASADVVKNVEVRSVASQAYWKMSDEARVQGSRIYVPDVVRTSEDMAQFVSKFTTDAQKLVPADAASRLANYVNDAAEAIPQVETPTNPIFVQAEALRNGINYEALPNGTWRVGDETVGSLREAGEAVHQQTLFKSEQNITDAYGHQYGFVFDQTKDGQWLARGKQTEKGGNILTGNHETLEGAARELWDKGFKPRLSQNSAANVIITPDGTGVEIVGQGEAITGPLEYIRDYAQQYFEKFDEAQILKRYGTDTIAKGDIENVFRVSSPEWGVIRGFTSFKEANKFLMKSRDSIEELLEIGLLKGVPEIQVNGGRIVARSIDGSQADFQTIDELRTWLKAQTPEPTWTKEVSNMDSNMVDTVWEQVDPELRDLYMARSGIGDTGQANFGKVLDHMKESPKWRVGGSMPASGEYGKSVAYAYAGTGFAQFLKDFLQTPMYARTRRIIGQTGRDVLGTGFETMEKALKNSKAIQAQTSELLHGVTAFKGAPKPKRRAVLRPLLEVDEAQWQAKAKQWNIDLDENDVRFMQRYRKASDTLGQALGIDPYRMINYYLPRIRDFMKNNTDIVAGASQAHEVLGKMDAKLVNELEFFSEFLRKDELVTFVNSADPMDLLSSYTRKGVKNMTLGKTYKTMKSKFDELVANGEITNQESYTFFHYLEQMMGMYSDEATKAAAHSAQETAQILAKRLGAKGNTKGFGGYINVMHGLTIASLMSFRPWPVLRNMMQTWVTLAPMFGNDSVMRATRVMADDKQAGEVWTRLHKSGRLQNKIPIHGGVYEATGKLGLANKFGMKWYKNSDDYTRMVVDVVVRDTFTDAVAKLEAGVVNEKQFIRLANLQRLDDFDQQEVMKRLIGYTDAEGKQIAGSFENAVDYYGDIVTRETMFAYTAGSNALAFQGMWGHLYGMFGHWPTFYAQTLANGMRRGNLLDKAVFAGRVVTNAAAMTFAFESVMGISAYNFQPSKAMFFGGGPYFGLITDALDAASGGYGGSTWASVRRDAGRMFMPGSLQAKSIGEGVELMAGGNTYDGLLRLMSAPLSDR